MKDGRIASDVVRLAFSGPKSAPDGFKPMLRENAFVRAFGTPQPRDVEGRKVGIRAYTQTTGLWLRGVLQHSYGVDLD